MTVKRAAWGNIALLASLIPVHEIARLPSAPAFHRCTRRRLADVAL
jgi:hypothetical protein